MRALEDADPSETRGYLSDALEVLSGQVNVTVEYAHADWDNGQWIDEGSTQIPFNLRELWDNPPSSFRGLAPPLYMMLDYGYYEVTSAPVTGEEFSLEECGWDGNNVYYRSGDIGDPEEQFSVTISGPPHHVHIAANVGLARPEIDLYFNWDWSQFTGTAGGESISGQAYEPLYTDFECRWDELPDKTISGLFPDADAAKDLIVEDYDRTVIRYKTLEIIDEPWVWW